MKKMKCINKNCENCSEAEFRIVSDSEHLKYRKFFKCNLTGQINNDELINKDRVFGEIMYYKLTH